MFQLWKKRVILRLRINLINIEGLNNEWYFVFYCKFNFSIILVFLILLYYVPTIEKY